MSTAANILSWDTQDAYTCENSSSSRENISLDFGRITRNHREQLPNINLPTIRTSGIKLIPEIISEVVGIWEDKIFKTSSRFLSNEDIELIPQDHLSAEALAKLGDNCCNRLEKFNKLTPGWDFGKGLTLSYFSIASMESFLNSFSGFLSEPSIFMSPEGHLQLVWEDNSGQDIELEFYPDKIEVYIEAIDSEEIVPLKNSELDNLTEKLTELQ